MPDKTGPGQQVTCNEEGSGGMCLVTGSGGPVVAWHILFFPAAATELI